MNNSFAGSTTVKFLHVTCVNNVLITSSDTYLYTIKSV